jgi:hypothetical protein
MVQDKNNFQFTVYDQRIILTAEALRRRGCRYQNVDMLLFLMEYVWCCW